MEGGLDVQGGDVPASSQGLHGRRDERSGGCRVFGLHRDTVRKMLAYSVPPGYRRDRPPSRPKLEPFTGRDRPDPGGRPGSVPRKQRHTAKRIFERLRDEHGFRRAVHHRQGLREGAPPPDPGDVRTLSHSAGPRPVRLWRGPGDHRRGGAEGPLLRPGPAPQRRLLRQGLSGRDHRGLPGRPRLGVSPPGRECPRAFCTTTPGWRWPGYWGTAGGERTRAFTELQSPTTCSRTGSAVQAKGTTRGRWRVWWAMFVGTSWCLSPRSRASMPSMPIWNNTASDGSTIDSVVTMRTLQTRVRVLSSGPKWTVDRTIFEMWLGAV